MYLCNITNTQIYDKNRKTTSTVYHFCLRVFELYPNLINRLQTQHIFLKFATWSILDKFIFYMTVFFTFIIN